MVVVNGASYFLGGRQVHVLFGHKHRIPRKHCFAFGVTKLYPKEFARVEEYLRPQVAQKYEWQE